MTRFLQQPYSGLDSLKSRLVFVASFLVLGVFLMEVLNPFNLTEWLHIPKWIAFFKLSGLAIFSTAVVALSQLGLRPLLKLVPYRLYHLLLTTLLELLAISLVLALIYGDLLSDFWSEYLNTAKFALTGTVLPYGMALLIGHFVGSKDKGNAPSLTPLTKRLHIKDDKGRLRLSLQTSDLLYLEASGNYVVVHYTDNDEVQQKSIRITLKKMEDQLSDLELLRCHRSFIVHAPSIHSIKKEEGIFQISLKKCATILPVSRSFEDSVKAYIE